MTTDVGTGRGLGSQMISEPIGGDCVELRRRSGARATIFAVSILLLALLSPLASVADQGSGRALSVHPTNGGIESTSTAVPAERTAASDITVERVRMVAAPPADNERTALVLFTLSNDSPATVADVVIEVSILARGALDQSKKPQVLAGPFYVKGSFLFQPGHITDYEVGLRDLSPGCFCRASVSVISARIVEQP